MLGAKVILELVIESKAVVPAAAAAAAAAQLIASDVSVVACTPPWPFGYGVVCRKRCNSACAAAASKNARREVKLQYCDSFSLLSRATKQAGGDQMANHEDEDEKMMRSPRMPLFWGGKEG